MGRTDNKGGIKSVERGVKNEDSGSQGKSQISGDERHVRFVQSGINPEDSASGRKL